MSVFNTYNDQELVGLLKAGDKHAYTEVYNRYKFLLYIFAYKRLGQREDALDVVHELFLSLWERRDNLNITGQLLPYLYTAVRNRIIDKVTRQKLMSRYIDEFREYLYTADIPTDHLARQRNLKALIDQEIAALPPKMRRVFELSRQTNLTRSEIARELNLSEDTVKSHMHHALKILKTKLGPLFVLLFFTN